MAEYSDLTVIIPTLNEEGNISSIIRELAKRYAGVHVIVSDDGSTDKTKKEAETHHGHRRRENDSCLIIRWTK